MDTANCITETGNCESLHGVYRHDGIRQDTSFV